jgi:hypothetical protein
VRARLSQPGRVEGLHLGDYAVEQEAIASPYAGIGAERFPVLAAAMGETMALLADVAAQFETAVEALVRGLEVSLRERGRLA